MHDRYDVLSLARTPGRSDVSGPVAGQRRRHGANIPSLCIRKAQGVIMNKEPPSSTGSESSRFFIGKNSRGNWVVQDEHGFRGGLFLDRIQALKFVKSENVGSTPAIIVMNEPFELDMRTVRGAA